MPDRCTPPGCIRRTRLGRVGAAGRCIRRTRLRMGCRRPAGRSPAPKTLNPPPARSVLWLLDASSAARANLRREAKARGVDPARLLFQKRAPLSAHLLLKASPAAPPAAPALACPGRPRRAQLQRGGGGGGGRRQQQQQQQQQQRAGEGLSLRARAGGGGGRVCKVTRRAGERGTPPPRTKWTRRVPHPVLIGHAASLTPY